MIHEKAATGFQRSSEEYERGRPEYPLAAVEFLVLKTGISSHSRVLELGVGTGKFTRQLLPFNATIVALEPVEGMRKKFSSLLPEVELLEGTAEAIPLASESVDAVIVAQAFHWFNGPLALKEICRVLRPKGRLGLLWNVRDESFDWVKQISTIIDRYEGGTPRYKTMEWKTGFGNTNQFSKLETAQFPNSQIGNIETIVDRVCSISFIASLPEAARTEVLEEVRQLLMSHPETKDQSSLCFPYKTEVYWCEKL